MSVENGEWIMRGMHWDDPYRIRTWQELVSWINEVGFLPLFGNEIEGFSVEEHVSDRFWWTGDREQDPWEWREIIASDRRVAYGKFFDKKAGFISLEWLPYFVNFRRDGYDFDARWEDGLASRREKAVMDLLTDRDEDGDVIWTEKQILTTDLKKIAGFGKSRRLTGAKGVSVSGAANSTNAPGAGRKTQGYERSEGTGATFKNFQGVITGLMMQTYLVTVDFHRRVNRRGEEYGMPVSVMLPPEAVWGYETVTAAYGEKPEQSWQRVYERVLELYPQVGEAAVARLIGKKP